MVLGRQLAMFFRLVLYISILEFIVSLSVGIIPGRRIFRAGLLSRAAFTNP